MATARMEIMRTVTAIIVAFQNVRDGKQESPAKFPGCPDFSTVPKERPASSDIESLVVRASAGRSPLAPRSFVNAGVNRRTASAYSGAVLLFAVCPSKQPAPRQDAADCGEYRQACGCCAGRFGSKADIGACPHNIRFTPKSSHSLPRPECPLCAKS